MILGIDEVGRGAWAGPLVVGAAALGDVTIDGLTDSKILTKKKREQLYTLIKRQAPLLALGWVSAADLDKIGLTAALKLAAQRAVSQLDTSCVDQIIIDGTVRLLDDPRVTLIKKADLLIPSVSAAAVIAKVSRDRYMSLCDNIFPGYGFTGHVGYGAKAHQVAIQMHGVLPIHRSSFAPIAAALGFTSQVEKSLPENRGQHAEKVAAAYLETNGYIVIDTNWRTRWCEIDIIAMKESVVYFVEVKYRSSHKQGGGLAAITPKKIRQMTFAAQLWLRNHPNMDAKLAALEVSGTDYSISVFIESI